MRAEQNPQLIKGRLVRVTNTATSRPHTGQGAVPNSGMAGVSSTGDFSDSGSGSGEYIRARLRKMLWRGLSLSASMFNSLKRSVCL